MHASGRPRLSLAAAILVWACVASGFAQSTSQPHYLITNDDGVFGNSVTFYTIGANGGLTLTSQVQTAGLGIGGGFFSTNRISLLNSTGNECVYAADAATGDIIGIDVTTLAVGGSASGSTTDSGATNGIGLAMNGRYLYASYTASNTIGTFQVQPGCSLSFVNDTPVVGLQAGFIAGMAIHGNLLVVTYGDGSIESFNIASGPPVSNNDEQNSTGYTQSLGVAYPNGVEITKDGRYAIFGDTSTSTVVEVSDISAGSLTTTVVYTLGTAVSASNITLSPDETLLYISNTQGDKVTAAFFNEYTGKVSMGCASGSLRGVSSKWSYLASLALDTNAGTGGTIYVAEFGAPSYIGMVSVSSSAGKCTLREFPSSPLSAANSSGLLSIGTFPPRSF
ncbi:MAG TPA: hypothetical protein VN310_00125 [Candidatus Dormibacteraeota bacterium]|jgi:hypothetical protein|nr:hypothetical protein [Candidatus Dormibacteraeota bacterium]